MFLHILFYYCSGKANKDRRAVLQPFLEGFSGYFSACYHSYLPNPTQLLIEFSFPMPASFCVLNGGKILVERLSLTMILPLTDI